MSASRLRAAQAVLTIAGVAVATYLTYVHYAGLQPICAVGNGCEKVQSSRWAEVAGVPVALLGLIGYVAILATLALRGERGRLAGLGLALSGLGFSGYLTYLELFEIHAICTWCVASAVIMLLLTIVAALRWVRGPAT
jgi:uncharacterized membrane protein